MMKSTLLSRVLFNGDNHPGKMVAILNDDGQIEKTPEFMWKDDVLDQMKPLNDFLNLTI